MICNGASCIPCLMNLKPLYLLNPCNWHPSQWHQLNEQHFDAYCSHKLKEVHLTQQASKYTPNSPYVDESSELHNILWLFSQIHHANILLILYYMKMSCKSYFKLQDSNTVSWLKIQVDSMFIQQPVLS